MIISRTPFRISFFGGGTDYHTWYREHGGAVLSTTINHYCYLTCRHLPPFFPEKTRVVWSRIEAVMDHDQIVHPAVRAVLQYMGMDTGLEVHHTGDLPARSGLGSSSAFTVGLLHALHALQGRMSNKRELACEAVHIEREVIRENVGVQDQIATAYGGFNKISILPSGDFQVEPVIVPPHRLEELQSHLLLFFTGVSRTASNIARDQMQAQARGDKKAELMKMREMVDDALKILTTNSDIAEFGKLLHESWQIKRSLSASVAPEFIDEIYNRAIGAGALGGKLLGAGGGGFMLFFAKPEHHMKIMQTLSDLLWVPFEFENAGSSIVFFDHNAYSRTSLSRRDYYHLKEMEAEKAQKKISEVIDFKKTAAMKRLTTV